MTVDDRSEWLEADGLGGFASGTVSGVRSRRYHAILLPATTPPTGRMVLVNGFDAWIETPAGRFAISSQRYAPDVIHPDGASRIESFARDPWPTWTFALPDDTRVEQALCAVHGLGLVIVSWRLLTEGEDVRLEVRPFLSGRDYHAMHHQNAGFRFDADVHDGSVVWRPYPETPSIRSLTNGEYRHAPDWYRNFEYAFERERGLDDREDLASPGTFTWNLSRGDAFWMLGQVRDVPDHTGAEDIAALAMEMRGNELRRRSAFATPLERAADAYLVRRGTGKTVVAGYPWFTDWGRDTFIAMRGLCLATGRLTEARDILLEWAGAVSEGMLPNRFSDAGAEPEFNAVDASLWYIVVVDELLRAAEQKPRLVTQKARKALLGAIDAILQGYASGTRHRIRADEDGLLAAGVPGLQLTWMDARVGDRVITPRIGKPVEIQALWLNALMIAGRTSKKWQPLAAKGLDAFGRRFWNDARAMLYDVVDVDHQPGTVDASFRPNQILAVGGLPVPLITGPRAALIVDAVERHLVTPLGLRSLAPGEPGYAPRYEGGPSQRDSVYHQGTVWAWLIGPFIDAWILTHGDTPAMRRQAHDRFLAPLLTHLDEAGLGHVSEIADGDPPHTPRGCPFQAWSVGEVVRVREGLRF